MTLKKNLEPVKVFIEERLAFEKKQEKSALSPLKSKMEGVDLKPSGNFQ